MVPDDEVETDKLGNVKPKKVDKEEPRTRREVLKTKQAGRRPGRSLFSIYLFTLPFEKPSRS